MSLAQIVIADTEMDMDVEMQSSPVSNPEVATLSTPTTLPELLQELKSLIATHGNQNGFIIEPANLLVGLIRKYKFWPALQVKKFYSNKNLVLLHNTYKRIDVSHFQQLYDQCRSVVLDMSPESDNNIVVSYADQIPTTISMKQYAASYDANDVCYEAFEGTVVTVYCYNGIWHFGTSSCPTVNSSRYFHPTNTHGMMLDDAIAVILGQPSPSKKSEFGFGVTSSDDLRKAFTYHLDPNRAYAFVLIHHDNKHVMDYTERFGANYAKLAHIIMRDRTTLIDIPVNAETVSPLLHNAFVYPTHYDSPVSALSTLSTHITSSVINAVNSGATAMYGFIATRANGQRFKVCNENVVIREEFDLGNPNKWQNMLNVYIQNKPHYKIVDYQNDFCPDLDIPRNHRGQEIAPTYIIHTVICTMRDILYNNYRASTTFNKRTKRFHIQREVDAMLPQIIKFHMAQLRNIQITSHDHSPITPHAVYHYLCHHQTMKNLRLLIKHFASNQNMMTTLFPPRTFECFVGLDALLST